GCSIPHPALRATFSRREKESCGAAVWCGMDLLALRATFSWREKNAAGRWCGVGQLLDVSTCRGLSLSIGRGCRRRVRDAPGDSVSACSPTAARRRRRAGADLALVDRFTAVHWPRPLMPGERLWPR